MPDPTPRYLVAPEGVDIATLRSQLEALGPLRVVSGPEELLGTEGSEGAADPGWIFVPAEWAVGRLHRLLIQLADQSGAWSPLLVATDGERVSVLPISPGYREEWNSALERMAAAGTPAALLSFRRCLEELSRIRHDINNPLTAALAETQLMLMESDLEEDRKESLEVVEAQLRRIAALVAELTTLRAPRSLSEA